jgi:hypothetical protein
MHQGVIVGSDIGVLDGPCQALPDKSSLVNKQELVSRVDAEHWRLVMRHGRHSGGILASQDRIV